jgi:hypothetical protein
MGTTITVGDMLAQLACCSQLTGDVGPARSTRHGHQKAMDHLDHSDQDSQYSAETRPLFNRRLPVMFKGLLDACGEGKSCPHLILTSRLSGFTAWNLDVVNTENARAAFATVVKEQCDDYLARQILMDPGLWLLNLRTLCGDRWSLDATQLALARKLGIIDKLPRMTEEEIDDLNKGDVFVKFLAVCQITWLCVQLITRVSRQLPTTQLEVVTLAFAVTSIITYALLYSRPKGVQTVREVSAARYPTPAELVQIALRGPYYFFVSRRKVSIPNNAIHTHSKWEPLASVTAILVVFGGLHLLAWNYEFPTQVERGLWQASAIITLATTPWFYILRLIPEHRRFARLQNSLIVMIYWIMLVIFVAARIFVLVEVVRSLAFQSPETFRTTWAASVPHVG